MADPEEDLNLMNPAERQAYYVDIFANKTERLHTLAFPSDLTDQYPALSDEICAAYLTYTIFAVEVWMNYDPSSQRFFNDESRARDCGKLRLPVPRKKKRKREGAQDKEDGREMKTSIRERLETLEFGRVRFEVHTPFTRLGSILVEVLPPSTNSTAASAHESSVDMRLRVRKGFLNRDVLFQQGLNIVSALIREDFVPTGRERFSLGDLDLIAEELRPRPLPERLTLGGWVRDTNAWTNFFRNEERNLEGYVDGLD